MKTIVSALVVFACLPLVSCSSGPEPALFKSKASELITNVTIIQPTQGRQTNQTIAIADGEISDIRPATEAELLAPERFVIPGLIDMHAHQPVALAGLEDYFELLYLRHGVTSVRYTGYATTGDIVKEQKTRINAGAIPGPRIFNCGPIIDGMPPFWPSSLVPASPAEAKQIVAGLATEGMDCIKVYSNISVEIMKAISETAGARDIPVVGHVPQHIGLADSGIDDAQHMIGVAHQSDSGKWLNPMIDGWHQFSNDRLQIVINDSLENNIAHTPTLVFLWTNAMRDRHQELVEQTDAYLLPNVFPDLFWLPKKEIRLGGERTVEMQNSLRHAYEEAKLAVGVMHEAGVTIHAGTDVGNPFIVQGSSLLKEIELLAESGLSNEAAIAAATSVPARSLGVPNLGTIQTGAPADLLVLHEDPMRNLSALGRPELVVAQGRIYALHDLKAEVARYREHYSGFLWDTLTPAIARLLN